MRLVHRFGEYLKGRSDLRYIVLSERTSRDLVEGYASLWRAFTRLRRDPLWSLVGGAIVAAEITYHVCRHKPEWVKGREIPACPENCPNVGTWHPHLNVLYTGEFIPFADLNAAWLEATEGNGRSTWIEKADEETIAELVKYVTKPSDLIGRPAAVDEFLEATFRRRFVRTYGLFYRLVVDDSDDHVCCPDCGSAEVVRVGMLPFWRVFLDRAGVFRLSGQTHADQDAANRAANPSWFGLVPGRGQAILVLDST